MRELFQGLITLIGAIIVTIFMWSIGTLYSFGYSIWLTITLKKWYAFFKFWWRLIDGFAAVIGHILYQIAIGLDMSWNVNGEIIEDVITAEENTMFSEKNITVSASTGKLKLENKLNKSGLIFSNVLNRVFNQKNHALDAWHYYIDKKNLDNKYFN